MDNEIIKTNTELANIKTGAIIAQLFSSDLIPVKNTNFELADYEKIPYAEIGEVGAIAEPVIKFIEGKIGIYHVNTFGKEMFWSDKVGGFISSLKDEGGKVGGGQAAITEIGIDPASIALTATIGSAIKKLDEISETCDIMFSYIVSSDIATLKADQRKLTETFNKYKYYYKNPKFILANINAIEDIKARAEQKRELYSIELNKLIKKHKVQLTPLDKRRVSIRANQYYCSYEFAIYLIGFSTFLLTVMEETFDKNDLKDIKEKLENYHIESKELYTKCYDYLEDESSKNLFAIGLDAVSFALDKVGDGAEKVPLINKIPIGKITKKGAEGLKEIRENSNDKTIEIFRKSGKSTITPFKDSINLVDNICNRSAEVLIDSENIYVKQIERS